MEDTLVQIECLLKRFEVRDKTTIFENKNIALNIRDLAENLKVTKKKEKIKFLSKNRHVLSNFIFSSNRS